MQALCPELGRPDSTPVTGVCPGCGLSSGALQVGAQTWHYCDECNTRWHVSTGDHPAPNRAYGIDAWRANADKLSAYAIVHPAPCVEPGGKPSLTQLIHAVLKGQERDRRRLGGTP